MKPPIESEAAVGEVVCLALDRGDLVVVDTGKENDAVIQGLNPRERRSVRVVLDVGVVKKQVAAREPLRESMEIINVGHSPAAALLLAAVPMDLVKAS